MFTYKSAMVYYDWLRDQIARKVPANEMVAELVGSSGRHVSTIRRRVITSSKVDPLKLAEDTAQAFLGVQIKCAQCHNHPFDRWTMNDYRGFVAFFTQIGRKKGEDPRETVVFDRHEGDSRNPITNLVIPAEVPGRARRRMRRRRTGACCWRMAGLTG